MPETSLKSVTVVSACSMVQLMLQFVFQMLLAKYFGASSEMDDYFAAMTLPMSISMITTGALANAFVPVFLKRREQDGPDAAWETMNSFGCFLIAVFFVIVVLFQLAADPLMSALHPGFSAEQKQLTASLFRIVSWLVLTNSLTSFLQSIHNGLTKFALPAAAPLAGILTSVIYAAVFHATKGMHAAAEAVVLGSVVNVARRVFSFPACASSGGSTRPRRNAWHYSPRLSLGACSEIWIRSLIGISVRACRKAIFRTWDMRGV